ncbi:Long-chain-fatty-acid--CoA ligase [Hyalangium minutum]|uniref:Long-chain-fatty-acid--CoA ligase n=1 Tax=Hyalangium minutum TaxID=394096 RepID=A0A085WFA2_9BACT|nr:Long-chain-fatty-acid--CoA ligase [Hyalangium minutum]
MDPHEAVREHTHSPASGGARQLWKEARTFADILRRRAAEQGQIPAFTFLGAEASEDVTLSYGELDRRARAIAMELEKRSLSGQRVLIVLPPGPASVASLFGCLYAGVIAVPVPPPLFDAPGLEPKLLAAIAQDSGAAAALVGGPRPAEGQRLTIEGLAAHIDLIPTEDAASASPPADWTPPFVDSRAIALLQYTAGTASTPKGVRVTHASLLDNSEALRRGLGQTASDKLLLWLPTHQGLGLLEGVLQPLYTGLPAVLLPPSVFFQKPRRWLEAISTHGATISGAPDFAYELCVRRVNEAERAGLDLSRWRVAFSSGEAVRAETMERFSSHFAPCGFQPRAFRPVYGLAECTYVVASSRSEDGPTLRGVGVDALSQQRITERRGAATKLVSCGPASTVQVIIVNPATRALRGDQEIGEVWVTGLSVADGYWGRVGTTSEAFRGRLSGSAAGMRAFMRTGDLGATSNGELYVTGRIQDVIIWEGQDLRLHDLEFDVEASHPALVPGSCAAFAHKQGREEQLIVVAEAFPPGTSQAAPVRMEALTREITRAIRLNVYQRHGVQPTELLLLRAGTLPRSSLGRVSRNAVRTAYPTFESEPLLRDRGEEPTETVSTLQVPAPTAAVATRGEAEPEGTIPTGLVPLTPAMHAVHAPAHAVEHPTGACRVFELPQGTRWQHVEEALHAVWMAHETLRLRFARSEAGGPEAWAAAITPEKSPVPLTRIELSTRPDEECWQLVERTARELGLELGQCIGNLASFVFCDRGPRSPAWLLAACHPSLLDESSWRILATDLAEACEQSRTRGRVRLTPQSGSLTRWVQELMNEIQLPRIASEARAHWLARAPVPAPARPSPASQELPAPGALAVIDAAALRRASTLFDVSQEALLLAACAHAYGTQLQRPTVRIGLEQSARVSSHYPVDASRMLGNLDFSFPATLALEPDAAPQEVARYAHAELLGAPLGGLAYDGLRAYGADRALATSLTALPAPDFTLHLADEGAPSSRESLHTLAIFESAFPPGQGTARMRVEARLSAERAQILWHGTTSEGVLLSLLAQKTEQTIRALCAQADGNRAAPAQGPGAARTPTAQSSH